jgi:hypothetical protein
VINGMRWYPKPVPVKMLRIFRRRFCSLAEVAEEIRRLRVIEAYIPSHQLARSNEFIVHYDRGRGCDLMLCGLQEHADGHELAPWRLAHVDVLKECAFRLAESHPSMAPSDITRRLRAEAACFVDGIRRMIMKAGLIPDLAGSRNLLVTKDLTIRLVDINNVSPVHRCDDIYLDDKGYPVCDKSIEALHLLETHLLQRPMTRMTPFTTAFYRRRGWRQSGGWSGPFTGRWPTSPMLAGRNGHDIASRGCFAVGISSGLGGDICRCLCMGGKRG